jgi:hypothetical protein
MIVHRSCLKNDTTDKIHPSSSVEKQIHFGPIVIVEFPVIIGDSIPREGAPLTLDAKAIRSFVIGLDRFECIRPERRRKYELWLDAEERISILLTEGCSLEDIANATLLPLKVRSQRADSSKNRFPKHQIAKAIVFTGRAIKNMLGAPARKENTAKSAEYNKEQDLQA